MREIFTYNKLEEKTSKRKISILGSTGSIGTQALDVIRQHADQFEVSVLTAGTRVQDLIAQAREFLPNTVVIADESKYLDLKEALADLPIKVFSGNQSVSDVAGMDEADMVVTALVGFAGLRPTLSAIRAGKAIGLANKETLVVAGNIVTAEAKKFGAPIIPIDSEHSAIFQCLAGEEHNEIECIYLTASGGPFRGKSAKQLENVNPLQALKHPNWAMGAKITIDSATLFNKGLEVIEARWLFGLKPDQIRVIVHPQSIIHSIVQFRDGSMKAQMGLPDMKLPIQYALAYPWRIKNDFPRFDFLNYPNLTFEAPDREAFPSLIMAFEALEKGGNLPCILNAANEVAVAAFLQEKLNFGRIFDLVALCMAKIPYLADPDLDALLATDADTRRFAEANILNPTTITRI